MLQKTENKIIEDGRKCIDIEVHFNNKIIILHKFKTFEINKVLLKLTIFYSERSFL